MITTPDAAVLLCNGVERLARAFADARAQDRAALIAFLAAGDPSFDVTVAAARAAAAAGADVIELGIAFSDPLADGPVIQAAYTRALDNGATLRGALDCATRVGAETGVPVVLMTALNPVLAFGIERFFAAAAEARVAGVLVPDLPVESADELRAAARTHGIGTVFMVAPDSSAQRVERASRAATGFVYAVRRRGVTGAGAADEATASLVTNARRHAEVPVALGFGIRTPADAADAARCADAVVVGSALVAAVHGPHDAGEAQVHAIRALLEPIRNALAPQ